MKKLLSVLALTSMVVACGGASSGDSEGDSGDSYSGNTSAATISADNKRELAESATYGAIQAKTGSSAPGPVGAQLVTFNSEQLVLDTISSFNSSELPTGATQDASSICTGGGSASYSGSDDGTDGTITYNNCNVGDGVVAHGKAKFKSDSEGSEVSIQYIGFRITVDGETTTLNMTLTCTGLNTVSPSCNSISDFTAANGETYRVENAVVSGNDSTGYSIQAKVYDSEYGSVSISSTALTFDCSNGLPSSGSITYTSGSDSATVTFDSCTQFTVTLNGTADIYSW